MTDYGYDVTPRLASLEQDPAVIGSDLLRMFGYNRAGQITSRTRSSYAVNGLNQYTQSGSVTPTYDARGNLTQAGG